MSDLISRQAAIDAICSVCGADTECDKSKFVYDAPQYEQVIMCPDHYALTHLPSAEPEIIRCRDCKNYYPDEDGRGYHCERDSNVRFSVHKDFYCADAERRTDE